MKNKEIEELLNDIKKQIIIDEKLGKEIAQDFHKTILNYEETKLLLSHVEQLKEELKEEQEENYKQSEWLVKKQKKIEQLENNRDKAIEYIANIICDEKARVRHDLCGKDIDGLINILKGDSDGNL